MQSMHFAACWCLFSNMRGRTGAGAGTGRQRSIAVYTQPHPVQPFLAH